MVKDEVTGLWDQGVFPHFCDTRESPPLYGGLNVFGKPFLLYHRRGHFPQPCEVVFEPAIGHASLDSVYSGNRHRSCRSLWQDEGSTH